MAPLPLGVSDWDTIHANVTRMQRRTGQQGGVSEAIGECFLLFLMLLRFIKLIIGKIILNLVIIDGNNLLSKVDGKIGSMVLGYLFSVINC